jgi:ribosome-associated protein
VTDAKPSKSARKREYQELQNLGEQLILLSDDQLADIETDEYLIEQVIEARNISSRGALRRQKQLIGKIMREVDPLPIRVALARFGQSDSAAKSVFKQAERWRDRIAAEGRPALLEFAVTTGQDSPQLVADVGDYENAPGSDNRRRIRRKMFREIHRILADV